MKGPARFLLLHVLGGLAVATVFVLALLLADPGGFGRLLAEAGPLPGLLLVLFCGGVFAIALAAGATGMPEEERPRRQGQGRMTPLRIPVRRR